MEELVNRALVFAYFSGKASPLQKKSIEDWLARPANQDTYYQWLHEWETTNLQLRTDWQKAFDTTLQRMEDSDRADGRAVAEPTHWQSSRNALVWLAAASVLCVLGLSGWLAAELILYQTVETGFGQTKSYTLPDGSLVDLNANSRIRFPRFCFDTGNAWLPARASGRRVELTGEADFSVRHLPDHQRFVVLTSKGLAVNVLGTQFTVLSRERRTHVVLRSGKVALTMPNQIDHRPLMMRPGDLATLEQGGKLILRQTAHPEKLIAWKERRFSFEKTSLREIGQILQENYGLNVTIHDADLASRTISGSFPAQNANEVLRLVAELLQINYIRDNNTVTFTN